MRIKASITALAVALAGVTGCAWFNDESPRTQDMTVNIEFSDVHLCSRISPEIVVTNPPEGTRFFDVRLMEYANNQERILGGGRWKNDGGVIPEGALTRHYVGPCPSGSEEYAYVVAAETDENSQPLAVRIYRFKPE